MTYEEAFEAAKQANCIKLAPQYIFKLLKDGAYLPHWSTSGVKDGVMIGEIRRWMPR